MLRGEPLDTVEGMRPAGAAVLVGARPVTSKGVPSTPGVSSRRREGPEEARWHHGRAHGPEAVVEGPWHLTSHPCRPKYTEVKQGCRAPQCDLRNGAHRGVPNPSSDEALVRGMAINAAINHQEVYSIVLDQLDIRHQVSSQAPCPNSWPGVQPRAGFASETGVSTETKRGG